MFPVSFWNILLGSFIRLVSLVSFFRPTEINCPDNNPRRAGCYFHKFHLFRIRIPKPDSDEATRIQSRIDQFRYIASVVSRSLSVRVVVGVILVQSKDICKNGVKMLSFPP